MPTSEETNAFAKATAQHLIAEVLKIAFYAAIIWLIWQNSEFILFVLCYPGYIISEWILSTFSDKEFTQYPTYVFWGSVILFYIFPFCLYGLYLEWKDSQKSTVPMDSEDDDY